MITACEETIARVHGEPGVELYGLHEGSDRLVMTQKYESEQRGELTLDLVPAVARHLAPDPRAVRLAPRLAGSPA